jgi:hypothetical protein
MQALAKELVWLQPHVILTRSRLDVRESGRVTVCGTGAAHDFEISLGDLFWSPFVIFSGVI